MRRFIPFIAIACVWCFLQGDITRGHFLVGICVGLLVMWMTNSKADWNISIAQTWAILHLIVFVSCELVRSSIRVTWDILTPTRRARARVIRIPVDDLDAVAITLLANTISLTPGSLTLEVSDDATHLYVHFMYADNSKIAADEIGIVLGNKIRRCCSIAERE